MYSELTQVELPLVKTLQKLGWEYIPSVDLENLRKSFDDPFIVSHLQKAIVRLNGDNGINTGHASAIIHKLRRIESNEEFTKWLKGEKSYKTSPAAKAITIRLFDFDNPENNRFVVTNQFKQSITHGVLENEKTIRPDIVLFINGIPVTVIECKFIGTEESTWLEGYHQLKRYQKHAPELFTPNCFNVTTDGHILKYGATGASSKYHFEWKYDNGKPAEYDESQSEFTEYNPFIDRAVYGLFNRETYLDLLNNFTVFETRDDVTIKKIARYQQYRATNKIVNRVLSGDMKTGLVWHTQGSGKSLTMLFTAWKLRKHPTLMNPTVLIVVDRKDLDTQISGTFTAAKLPNTTRANSIQDLRQKLLDDRREVIITTVFKFNEMKDIFVDRENVILLIDEAHRSQEGINAIEMRDVFKNAYLFGFTGTPIDRSDHNTHRNFGMRPDGKIERYLDLYNIKQAIEDKATVPVHYQLRNMEWHLDGVNLDNVLKEEFPRMEDAKFEELKRQAGTYSTFMMKPERLESIAKDIKEHFTDHVAPNGYKAQVVCFTRKACVMIKNHLDKLLNPEVSKVIYTGAHNDNDELRKYHYSSEKKERIVRNFKNPEHPLKILLVQSMLLTGFDAPVEQVMYLDRPLRDHTLLQAIARTNRPYRNKQCGIIIDYCGILKRLRRALNFNEKEIEKCLIDFDKLKEQLPFLIEEFKDIFLGIDPSNMWNYLKYIKDNDLDSKVRQVYNKLQATYETIAPDPFLLDYHDDYVWATKIMIAWKQFLVGKRPDVSAYLAHTKALIQNHVNMSEIDQTAPEFVVDDNYLRRIDELPGNKEQRESLLENRLRAILQVRQGHMPIYNSLMKRLKAIITKREKDILEMLTELAGDLNEAMKLEAAMGMSMGEMALQQLVKERVHSEKADELVARLKESIEKHVFPGWQKQPTVQATIKRDIILEIAKYDQEHSDIELNPDEYSKFSQEAMKYVEKLF